MTREVSLRRLIETVAKDHKYDDYECDIKEITTGGANYTSYLYQIKISAADRDDLKIFAKVAAFGEEMRKDVPMEQVYHLEIYYYQTITKMFRALEEKYHVPEKHKMFMSNMYAFSKDRMEEILILDDLIEMGYKPFDRFKTLGWKEMARLVEELAKFHALSFAYGQKHPEEFAETLKQMKTAYLMKECKEIYGFWCSMIQTSGNVLEGRNKELYEKFAKEQMDTMYDQFLKPGKQVVFIHGDYRPNNMVYKVDENGKMDLVVLDYQTLRSGCVLIDLLYVIFISTNQEFKNQYYDQLIEYYYTQLREALQRLDVDPDLVYPRDVFESELKDHALLGLAIAAYTLQIITVDETDAPKVDGDLSLDKFQIKTNSLFKERFTEVVEDYINRGILQ